MHSSQRVLVTGGSGYVGGRLIPLLESQGRSVRCLARRPDFLRPRVAPTTEIAAGDVLDPASLQAALTGVEVAYYLVHSLGAGGDFEAEERAAARNFAAAARAAGVRKIIYLGGLGSDSDALSKHLRSRHEVGRLLLESGAQVLEFRASIVIGSGSLSFELIRALVQKLPVMLCPRWVATPTQPIAIEDLLAYLLAALDLPAGDSEVFEIGGPDRVSYGDIMQEYARQRGLRRYMISVPLLSPRLSSLWLGLVTPVYARVGRKLVESLRNPTVASDARARQVFGVRPRGVAEAIARALVNEDRELAATRWSDALSSAGPPRRWGGARFGTRLVDSRVRETSASPERAFAPIQRVGGRTGWYGYGFLWRLRGWLDLLVGGVGLRRGRRDPVALRVGDAVDCWRVEAIEPNRRLRLAAEMRLPGRAWLEFEVEPTPQGARVRQTAEFDPVGLAGLAYWYGVYPLHQIVFAGMLRNIVAAGQAVPPPTSESTVTQHATPTQNVMPAHHDSTTSGAAGTRSADHAPRARPGWATQVAALAALAAVCFAAAAAGGAFTSAGLRAWYATLAKPDWTPPNWLFGPVWTALYLMMAVAAWWAWRQAGWRRFRGPLALFLGQLALNVGWSALFFGLRSPGWALVEIAFLWLAIVASTLALARLSRLAAGLMLPYLAWTTFAAVLNLAIWRLNL